MADAGHYARRYAARGWRVFPLEPGAKRPLKGLKWLARATDDEGQIARWWDGHPDRGSGLALGASRLLVIDIDSEQGEEAWATVVHERGGDEPINTLEVQTGRGRHIYFSFDADDRRHVGVKNQANTWKGVDVKTAGGYVVLPPSLHPSGVRYQWSPMSAREAMPVPGWLYDAIIEAQGRPRVDVPREPLARREPSTGTSRYGARALDEDCAIVAGAGEGSRNNTLNERAYRIGQLVAGGEITEGDAESRLLEAAMAAGLGEGEARRTISSGMRNGMQSPRSAPPRDRRPAVVPPPPSDDDAPPPSDDDAPPDVTSEGEWFARLLRSKDGQIKGGLANVAMIIAHHPALVGRLGRDERSEDDVWIGAPPWGDESDVGRPVNDADGVEAAVWLALTLGVSVGREVTIQAMEAAAQARPFDRVRDWLDGLQWDGVERVPVWLTDYLGVEPSPLARAIGTAWMISAVARTYEPGCKVDTMLVLEGGQGIGKSRALAALGGDWYADLAISPGDRDSVLAIHGPWIVEWSELSGLSRRESEEIKAFLSRQIDDVRAPYGRRSSKRRRRCVIAASTNETEYLLDASGNRRYWPVRCGVVGAIDVDGIVEDRSQLWAEAVVRYRRHEIWRLTPELETEARHAQDARRVVDPWLSEIADVVSSGDLEYAAWIKPEDILRALGVERAKMRAADRRRVKQNMENLGWRYERVRTPEGRPWAFVRPS